MKTRRRLQIVGLVLMACFAFCVCMHVYVGYTCRVAAVEWLQNEHPELFPEELTICEKVRMGMEAAHAIPGCTNESPIEKFLMRPERMIDSTESVMIPKG